MIKDFLDESKTFKRWVNWWKGFCLVGCFINFISLLLELLLHQWKSAFLSFICVIICMLIFGYYKKEHKTAFTDEN